jgi:hypothetical protein
MQAQRPTFYIDCRKNIISLWDEDTPVGLQRKFYHIASVVLAWRGGEAFKCLTCHLKQEINNDGSLTSLFYFAEKGKNMEPFEPLDCCESLGS